MCFRCRWPLASPADHAKFRSCDSAALGLLDLEFRAGAQAFERRSSAALIGAGVDQRANRHVSADAGEGVQVADLHAINWGSSSPDGPCRNSSIASESAVSAILISTTRAPDDFAICARPAAG